MKKLQSFWIEEDGAVTVDWVVLTAAVVVLGVAVANTIQAPVNSELTEIATELQSL